MRYFIIFLIIFIDSAWADDWDEVRFKGLARSKSYDIAMGTGFFISNNYIITNKHVVNQCLSIAVRGAVKPSSARLVAVDPQEDLALLYTTSNPRQIANLRSNDGLNTNDFLTIIGYPLTHSTDGTYIVTHSSLMDSDTSITSAKETTFIPNIEHGNSGSPLLDSSGNVIGVVEGVRDLIYTDELARKTTKRNGIAVGLGALKEFLNRNSLYFRLAPSSGFVTNYNIENQASNYIVNIHCVKYKSL